MKSFLSNLLHAAGNARKASRPFVLAVIFVILLTVTIVYYLNTPGRLVEEGLRYRKEGKWRQAVDSFKKSLSFGMKSPHAVALLGEEYFCAGDFTRGKFYLSKAVQFKPADARAVYYMGALYACQGDSFNTTVMLREFDTRTGGKEREYCSLLKILTSVMFPGYPNFVVSADEEKKVTDLMNKPEAPLFLRVQRGLIDIYKGRFDEARKLFEELVSKHPDDPNLLTYHAITLTGCGRKEEAMARLQAALRKNDKSPLAQQYLGALYLEDGLLDDSLKALQSARSLSPGAPGPGYYLGLLYIKKGSLSEARGFLEESLLKQPNHGMAHQKLGEVYEKLGMKKKAQEEFEKKTIQGGPLYIVSPPY